MKIFKEGLGLGFLRAMDIHFRFDDGHQARCKDLGRHLELLIYDVPDPSEVDLVDDRTHLGAENALCFGFFEQRSELRHRFHQAHAVFLLRKAVVHFQERDDSFHSPEIVRRGPPLDVPIHSVLKKDGAKDPFAVEAGAGDDAGAHPMHNRKHLIFVGPRSLFDAIGS